MLKRMRCRTKGQSLLEYMIMITIILGAALAISVYFKRGIQGRWKATIDDMGDQYDPRLADTSIRHTLVANTVTMIQVMNTAGGFWTQRTDTSNVIEQKTGYSSAAASY